ALLGLRLIDLDVTAALRERCLRCVRARLARGQWTRREELVEGRTRRRASLGQIERNDEVVLRTRLANVCSSAARCRRLILVELDVCVRVAVGVEPRKVDDE